VLATAGLAAFAAVFHRALFSREIFISRDILRVYAPMRAYWVTRVMSGELPEWLPHDGLGLPFVSAMVTGAFHPTNLLALVMPVGESLKWTMLLAYLAALLGTYCFARSWQLSAWAALLAAFCFVFSGYVICISNNMPYLLAASTFPWALWAAGRYLNAPSVLRAATCALCLTLVLSSGDPQSFVITCALCVLFPLIQRNGVSCGRQALHLAGLFALTATMCAVQFAAAFQALRDGRVSEQRMDISLLWSLHPVRLVELAVGPIFGGAARTEAGSAISLGLLKQGYPSGKPRPAREKGPAYWSSEATA
jgi:hypothetical protein